MRYEADYMAYELGNFLIPCAKYDVFILLLQNINPDSNADTFSVKLGKTRKLNTEFYTDCLKILIYSDIDGGEFSIYPIELKIQKDGSKIFDAEAFLKKLDIKYKAIDTSGYRYFKSRFYECENEIIIKEDLSEFSIIHRRINADDFESLKVYRNINKALKNAYFIITRASSHLVRYREVWYFSTEEEVMNYIKHEFTATDGAELTRYTIDQLMEGKSYEQSHRMGAGTTTTYVQVIHNTNLSVLYYFLDSIDIKDRVGKPVYLSKYLKEAKTEKDIEKVIYTFNNCCDNYW